MLHKQHNPLDRCQLKFSEDEGVFTGYASVFNNDDADGDTILPGAFKGVKKVPMLYGHNPHEVIGKYKSLKEDKVGLVAEGEFTPGHSKAQDVYASMKHEAVDGLSIGFRIPSGGSKLKDEDNPFGGRIIKNINLVEISVVAFPANDDARISTVKEVIDQIESLKDAELYLRESGNISRNTAIALVGRIKELYASELQDNVKDEITERDVKLEWADALKFVNGHNLNVRG